MGRIPIIILAPLIPILLLIFLFGQKLVTKNSVNAIEVEPCKVCDLIYGTCVNSGNPSCSFTVDECSVDADCRPFTPTPSTVPATPTLSIPPSPTLPPVILRPFCDPETVQACNYSSTSLMSLVCQEDLDGGHCVSRTTTTADCLANCLASGNTPTACNISCPATSGAYCSSLKTDQCSQYYLNYKCEPDVRGGHCVPESLSLKDTGESCQEDGECRSGRCDFLPIHNARVCVPADICTPGEIIPKDSNLPLSCSLRCSPSGTSWITQWDDCNPQSEAYRQYCDGSVLKVQTVVYENGAPVVSEQSINCSAGCAYGACITNAGQSCIVGDYSYVQGSCSGIQGCTNPNQNFDGNCLASCNSSGRWEVTPACGRVTIPSNFSETQRYQILQTFDEFDENLVSLLPNISFEFTDVALFYELPSSSLDQFLNNLFGNYNNESNSIGYCGYFIYEQGNPVIHLARCGLATSTYAHEITHFLVNENEDLLSSYSSAIGCEESSTGSEEYQFSQEGPVAEIEILNCSEALGQAAGMYQRDPCSMQTQFPIQYDWVRDNLHSGQEFCNQTSLVKPNPIFKKVAGVSVTSLPLTLNKSFPTPSVLATTLAKTYAGLFALGSTQLQVTSELGTPASTESQAGATILSYNTQDPVKKDVFIFNSESKLIYFRINQGRILDSFQTVEPWIINFKNPEAVGSSSTAYLSTRFIYSRLGFSFVALNDTAEVVQYEAFTPIYIDEYLDSWGTGLREEEVGYPTTHKKGDINRDLVVNNDDYGLFLPEFGKKGFSISDIDWDRAVDGVDYVIWLNNTPH